jgi:hypothetical protein
LAQERGCSVHDRRPPSHAPAQRAIAPRFRALAHLCRSLHRNETAGIVARTDPTETSGAGLLLTHSGPQPSQIPHCNGRPTRSRMTGRPPGCPVTSRGARAGLQGATHCDKNFWTLSTERLDRAQWSYTIRIVHRHCRVFQRGRRGATLRKGRSMMGQAWQCTCAEGQRTGRSIDRSEPCHGWLLMR